MQKSVIQNIRKIQIFKIKIRVTQNVGKVWISRKKVFLAPFHAISDIVLHGPEKMKNAEILQIFLGGPRGPYSPGLGSSIYICLDW